MRAYGNTFRGQWHTQLGNIDAELRNVNGQLESIAAFSDGPVFAYNQAA